MEFHSNKEISDNVGVDSEVQKTGRQKRTPACSTTVNFVSDICDFYYHFEGSSPQAC
jgi:hypothetical protein